MSVRAERLAARAGAAALGMGALGMAFERADPTVSIRRPVEFAAWARRHHRALTAQSAVYLANTAPLVLFLAGLGRSVSPPVGLLVVAGGTTWVAFQDAAQAAQLATARAAREAEPAATVTRHGERTETLMERGNVALAAALAGVAADAGMPRWLRGLSAATAAAHVAPAAVRVVRERPADGAVALLPYPLFVAWLVGVVVTLGRR